MEVKKSPKASLENKRLLFTEIGLVVALLVVYLAFNWSSRDAKVAVLEDTTQALVEDEMIAIQDNLPLRPRRKLLQSLSSATRSTLWTTISNWTTTCSSTLKTTTRP